MSISEQLLSSHRRFENKQKLCMINTMVARVENLAAFQEESRLAKLLKDHFKVIFSTDPVVYRLLVDEQIQALMSNNGMSEIEAKKVVYQMAMDSLGVLINPALGSRTDAPIYYTRASLYTVTYHLYWTYHLALLCVNGGGEDLLSEIIHGYRVSTLDLEAVKAMTLDRQQYLDIVVALQRLELVGGGYYELNEMITFLKIKAEETTS